MQQNLLKKLLPHGIAIALFFLLTVLYLSPMFFEGKVLNQHDIMQWKGMSKEIMDHRAKYHEEPLWTNSMFGGMPAYQIFVEWKGAWVKYIDAILTLGLPEPASFIFLGLLCAYLLFITLKVDYRLSIAGAIAYAFSCYNFVILSAGHHSKAHAIALFPLVIAGVLMVFQKRWLFGGMLTAAALALELYATHLQITYYLFITILVLAILEFVSAIKQKQLLSFVKSAAIIGAAAGLAVLCNISNLWATEEYGKYSTRSQSELEAKKVSTGLDKDYATGWSYGKLESMTLLIPNFSGGASMYSLDNSSATYKALVENGGAQQAKSFAKQAPVYWGEQPSSAGPTYFGAAIIFLFVLSLFILKGPVKWWLIAATLVSLLLAWGKNFQVFTDFFFDYFPGYNKFRTVAMILVIASFTVCLGAILSVKEFVEGKLDTQRLRKSLLRAFYIVGGICAIFLVVPGLFADFTSSSDEYYSKYDWLLTALHSDRESMLRMDAFRSLFFVSAAFFLLWFYLKKKLKVAYLYIGLSAVVLIDMWLVDKRFFNNDEFVTKSKAEAVFQPTQADLTILQDTSLDYRVMNTSVSTFNDATTSYHHKSIGGYHGAKLKRYQELIENQISKNNMEVLNMLNTKYVIAEGQDNQPQVRRNPGVMGNAWFVKEYKIVPNADSEMSALSTFKAAETAIIDKRFEEQVHGFTPQFDSTAAITMTSYKANDLVYKTKASSEQLAVFSEIYYPKGWNAYVDGKNSPYFRANYVLRSMRVPAGEHTIEFKFEPEVYNTGGNIAMAASVLLYLLIFGALFVELKRSKNVTRV
jgi:hypothetical protein